MTNSLRMLGLAAAVALAVSACGGGSAPAPGASAPAPQAAAPAPSAPAAPAVTVPAPYAGKKSPLAAGDAAAIAAGQKLYAENCATCHGETGHGDGPAAAALEPKPRNLSEPGYVAGLGDDHLLWRISEGGVGGPAGSAMPPWKDVLKEDQVWQVVAYVRSLAK